MQGIVGHSVSETAWFFVKLLALNSPQAVVCVSTFTFLACISCYTLNFYCYLQWITSREQLRFIDTRLIQLLCMIMNRRHQKLGLQQVSKLTHTHPKCHSVIHVHT